MKSTLYAMDRPLNVLASSAVHVIGFLAKRQMGVHAAVNSGEWRLLRQFKSGRDIHDFDRKNKRFSNINDRRAAVQIAVIDDRPFDPETNLRSHNYNIRSIGDIKHVDEVKEYPIVLCDLMGVGVHFDKRNQGSTLIKEIRANYPSIFVLAYTGSAWGSPLSEAAAQTADDLIQKDIDIPEWVEKLDHIVRQATDPYAIWMRTRHALVAAEIDTKDLLRIEDAYVRAILAGDPSMGPLSAFVAYQELRTDVRAVIQNLAASTVFRAIFG